MKEKICLPRWKNKSMFEKILTVIGMITASFIVILMFLQMFEVLESEDFFIPLLGLLMFIQTLEYYKYNKTSSIICLVSTIIIFSCYILKFFI